MRRRPDVLHPSKFCRVGIVAHLPHAAYAAFKPDAFPAADHHHREHSIGSLYVTPC